MTSDSSGAFAATRWTLVLRARGETTEAQAALSELCDAYYQPVLRFLRSEGRDEDNAREFAQEFFARILSRNGFANVDPERGRFRSYLLGALKHFLADSRERELRQKRGGGAAHESLHSEENQTDAGLQVADPHSSAPDANFDREWALAVMARALESLELDMTDAGKAEQFHVLKPWLMGEGPALSQADAARQLGVNEGAVKVAVHRLRKQFRETVRREIAQTLRDATMVEEELRHLIAALA